MKAIVKEALKRKTGARGLRAILEERTLDIMYESPSQQNLKEIIITEECIISGSNPIRVFHTQKKTKSNKENSTVKSKKNLS